MELAARVRAGTAADTRHAAALHVANIPDGFLATLGPGFLDRLYRRVASSPEGFLLVACDDDGPVGFLAGTTDVGRLYRRFLVRDAVAAAVRAPIPLLRAVPRAFETLRYGADAAVAAQVTQGRTAEVELLALAVHSGWRRRGVGSALVEAFADRAATSGAAAARVVVGAANDRAIALYRRHGFTPAAELQVHHGVPSLLMRAPLRRPVAR